MAITDCAGCPDRDPDYAIALGRGTGNKRPCQGGNPAAGVGVDVTIDHGQIIHSTCRDASSCVGECEAGFDRAGGPKPKSMTAVETGDAPSNKNVIAGRNADTAVLKCDTVVNVAAAIDHNPIPNVDVSAQIFDSRQGAGRSLEPGTTPATDRTITNSDVDMVIDQNTVERSADPEDGKTGKVERHIIRIDPDAV